MPNLPMIHAAEWKKLQPLIFGLLCRCVASKGLTHGISPMWRT